MNASRDETDFARIAQLFEVGKMGDALAMIVGCGSGGGSVALQLVMSGIKRFSLFDRDVLKRENVIRHVCGRRYLGQRKVDALEDVLHDRNPTAVVTKSDADLMSLSTLEDEVEKATVVVLATDNEPTRFRLNELCVRRKRPMVVGRVFTRGIGGDVFAYRPGESGCLACLERVLERTTYREGIHEIDLVTQEERDAIYGSDVTEIKDSPGLNVDISFITSFHTRFVLDAIARTLRERPKYLAPIDDADCIIWGNRPVPPFSKHFQLQRVKVHPQTECLVCGTRSAS